MRYKQTTQVPNEVFDIQLKNITHSELKLLLYIIRKTYGWQLKNGNRKNRDRISHSQFIQGTGISRRSIPTTIQSLIFKRLIKVTDYSGQLLHSPKFRKGKVRIYYAPLFRTCANVHSKMCNQKQKPVQTGLHNKTKRTKLRRQKRLVRQSDWERMLEIIEGGK